LARSLVSIFLLVLATTAFAKPYPLPCSDLWSAVTDTLGNERNYTILSSDNIRMKAYFIVIGSSFPATHTAYVKARPKGCELEVRMGFTGLDDEGFLRSRVNRAFVKRRSAKPTPPASSKKASE